MKTASKDQPLKIAVAGLGTVGAGLLRLAEKHASLLEDRSGRPILVTAVSARDRNKNRGVSLDGMAWFDDPVAMAARADADVVVELIGGSDGIARQFCETALGNAKHVVTANKALLAHHGTELALVAEEAGVTLAFEAAVAGGIPIIKSLREGLAGNPIRRIYGILNGTCNYILTAMHKYSHEFNDVLKEAQKQGYAEADPGFDVDGIDTAHKLAILASMAFGARVNFDGVYVEGIRHVSLTDIRFARELGYRIKLLGTALLTNEGVEQRVHPCMVPLDSPIAHVEGVFNAVVADGDFSGTIIHEGCGAGAGPTASAVAADLVDIARGHSTPTFSIPAKELKSLPASPLEHRTGPYYIRLMVVDRPGVFADVAAALGRHDVSMESVIQRARAPGEQVPVVMIIHDTREDRMAAALADIGGLEAVVEPPRMIRIESF